jgi:hypothetical protein
MIKATVICRHLRPESRPRSGSVCMYQDKHLYKDPGKLKPWYKDKSASVIETAMHMPSVLCSCCSTVSSEIPSSRREYSVARRIQ